MKKWPEAPTPQCGETNRKSVGRLRSYITTTFAAMSLRDWVGTPRAVSLRVVDAYRRGSALEQRCGRTGPSCSTLGRAYIARYGAVQGWARAVGDRHLPPWLQRRSVFWSGPHWGLLLPHLRLGRLLMTVDRPPVRTIDGDVLH